MLVVKYTIIPADLCQIYDSELTGYMCRLERIYTYRKGKHTSKKGGKQNDNDRKTGKEIRNQGKERLLQQREQKAALQNVQRRRMPLGERPDTEGPQRRVQEMGKRAPADQAGSRRGKSKKSTGIRHEQHKSQRAGRPFARYTSDYGRPERVLFLSHPGGGYIAQVKKI